MSAMNDGDVTLIKDEDVLKRMWQETEDFGKKKEIRAHMYKLREARLRDLYTTSDVINTTTEKSCTQSTHADNLADHSFMSLKSKEIRDSESPTRDISYRISTGVPVDAKWNINKVEERTNDGKAFTSTQSAECAGTELIPKGKIDFEAKNQQSLSVFEDGDDKNYIKKAGSSSNTFVKQEAVGGDENSSFRSSSMKTSSSSKTVTEQKSSYDFADNIPSKSLPYNTDSKVINTSTKTYTTDIPDDLKRHPGFVDGKTKVTRETKTLADGTVVTTTKYETTGVNTAVKSSQENYSSSSKYEERSSSRTTSSNSLYEKKDHKENNARKYIESRQETERKNYDKNISSQKFDKVENFDNRSNVHEDYKISKNVTSENKTVQDYSHQFNDIQEKVVQTKDDFIINKQFVDNEIRDTSSTFINKSKNINDNTNAVKNTYIINKEYVDDNTRKSASSVTDKNIDIKDTKVINTEERTQYNKIIKDDLITSEQKTEKIKTNIDKPSYEDKTKKTPKYEPIEKRESIKPVESNFESNQKPLKGQYDTTYNTDFTSKRISVDISPTHNAFASSLRAVSPEKISKCTSPTRGSTRSLKSPEKTTSYRTSPERKPTRKSPEKFSSTETITYKSPRTSPDKSSPERHYRINKDEENLYKTYSTETITKNKTHHSTDSKTFRRNYVSDQEVTTDIDEDNTTKVTKTSRPSSLEITTKTNKVTERSSTSPIKDYRTSPTKDLPDKSKPPLRRTDTYEERCRQILGIDSTEKRKNSLEKTKKRGSGTSETIIISTEIRQDKESVFDKYSPKTSPTKEKGKPIQDYPSEIKKSPEDVKNFPQNRKSPEKYYQKASSPTKDKKPIQEFPSQVRKSPEKSPDNYLISRKSPEKSPSRQLPRKDSTTLQEFPSQIRRSPERKPHLDNTTEYPKNVGEKVKSPSKPIQEFPSQTRKTSTDKSVESITNIKNKYNSREVKEFNESPRRPSKTIEEFPSQTRKVSGTVETTDKIVTKTTTNYDVKKQTDRKNSKPITEFPSQIKRTSDDEINKSSDNLKINTTETQFDITEYQTRPNDYTDSQISETENNIFNDVIEISKTQTKAVNLKNATDEFTRQEINSLQQETEEFPRCDWPKNTQNKVPKNSGPATNKPAQDSIQNIEQYTVTTTSVTDQVLRKNSSDKPYPKEYEPRSFKLTNTEDQTTIEQFPSQQTQSPDKKSPKRPFEKEPTSKKSPEKSSVQEYPSQKRKLNDDKDTPKHKQPVSTKKQPKDSTREDIQISIQDITTEDTYTILKDQENKKTTDNKITETYVLKAVPNENSEYSNQNRRDTYEAIYVVKDIKENEGDSCCSVNAEDDFEQYILNKKTEKTTDVESSSISISKLEPSLEHKIPNKTSPKKQIEKIPSKVDKTQKTTNKSLNSKITKVSLEQLNVTNKTKKNVDETDEIIEREDYDLMYAGKTPVEEPIINKKKTYLLGKEDETDQTTFITDVTQKNIIKEQNIKKTNTNKSINTNKTLKNTTTNTADERRKSVNTLRKTFTSKKQDTINAPKLNGQPEKKPLVDKNRNKPKMSGETEYTDKYGKPIKSSTPKKEPQRQNTLSDIENFENIKEDNSIHIRTNRVDETVNKKKVSATSNKTSPTKTPSKTSIPTKRVSSNVIPTKKPQPKIYTFSSSTRTNPVGLPKTSNVPKKNVPKTPSTKDIRRPSKGTKTQVSTQSTKIEAKTVLTDSESDTESIADSLEGSIRKKSSDEMVIRKIVNTFSKVSPKPEIIEPKVSRPKLDKKSVSSKSLLSNDTEKHIIVDLIRSTSSREPTPDRMYPLPVNTDDESVTPRYPDKVTEPDECTKGPRKTAKIIDSTILEDQDVEVRKIVEITDEATNKITQIDKVDENDDSLLSVNRKINKFISTAEKLTPKPIVDISQPAPKVERPTFEVDENLKEDVCILSVSDKVKKFKTTTENLQQTNKNKTVQETTKTNVFEKVNQFTKTAENKSKSIDVSKEIEENKVLDTAKKFTNVRTEKKENISLSSLQPTRNQPQTEKSPIDFIERERNQLFKESDKYPSKSKPTHKNDEPLKTNKYNSPEDKQGPTNTLSKPKQQTTVTITSIGVEPTTKPSHRTDFIATECAQIEKEDDLYRVPTDTKRTDFKSDQISFTRYVESPKSSQVPTKEPFDVAKKPKNTSPTRKPSSDKVVFDRTDSYEGASPSKVKQTNEFTPKSTRRPSQEEKIILSSAGRLRSTESIKRAKALFENSEKDTTKKTTVETKKVKEVARSVDRSNVTPKRLEFNSPESKKSPSKDMPKSTRRTPEKHVSNTTSVEKTKITITERKPSNSEITSLRDSSNTTNVLDQNHPSDDTPNYMKPLDRSLRLTSPHRENIPVTSPEPQGKPTKFGITLRRTDSGRAVTTNKQPNGTKKHPILFKSIVTEEEIEEIFEVEVLEELLLKITGYELRRKVRMQIKLVKQLIIENRLEIYIEEFIRNRKQHISSTSHTNKKLEPKQVPSKTYSTERKTYSEAQEVISDSINRRKESNVSVKSGPKSRSPSPLKDTKSVLTSVTTTSTTTTRKQSNSSIKQTRSRSVSPEKEYYKPKSTVSTNKKIFESSSVTSNKPVTKVYTKTSSPEKETRSSYKSNVQSSTITRKESSSSITKSSTRSRSVSQEKETKPQNVSTKKVYQTTLNKTERTSKPSDVNGQPEWVRNRNLRKVEGTTKTTDQKIIKKNSSWSSTAQRNESKKEEQTVDVITSSYGVGPTDEYGSPLFGLKALRAQNNGVTSKVQGTVVTSHYYAETGKEPVGEVSVTKYSTDPNDLSGEGGVAQDGDVLSVTMTQKFGYNDTPSLKQLKNNEKNNRHDRQSTKSSSSLTRKNSVKALTQKFVENRDNQKTERRDSYPKAGLILRSSSFKSSSPTEDKEEFFQEEKAEASMYVKTSSSTTVTSGDTFLTNKSRVTGVKDVISRMKAEDYQEGESEEDREAKNLLNKFLGSQVILSGLEGSLTKTTAKVQAASVKRTTKVTLTTTENGKQSTKTLIFEHPITEEVLETLWDEEIIKYLLEQSQDYEERKRLRARLRVVMSEQAACTELAQQASQDQSGGTLDEKIESSEKVITEGPVTTKITTKVSSQQQQFSKKPLSPFAKFRQLDKQNSLNTPPGTPKTPLSASSGVLFKFTDESLSQSASTIKERLLHWCRMKTKEYENIQLDNFSTSWADGLAFCALIHHFIPDAFDYHALTPKERRHNFTLAFKVADEKADIAPLLDVDDMVETRRPDWKCVFTYVQSIYRHFKDVD